MINYYSVAFIDTSSLEASFETVENQELPLLPSELVYYAWGGGGLLSLEKGTNCGPTSQELALSRAKMATKRGAVQS